MTSYLIDINVWLALSWTLPRSIMGDQTHSITEALRVYDEWLRDLRVEFRHESFGTSRAFRSALSHTGHQQAPKAIADCYLAAFAQNADATLVTFDRALAQLGKRLNLDVELLQAD